MAKPQELKIRLIAQADDGAPCEIGTLTVTADNPQQAAEEFGRQFRALSDEVAKAFA